MNRFRHSLLLALAGVLAPAASAQTNVPVRIEGTVSDLLGGSSTSFPGAALGDRVTLDVVLRTPGTTPGTGQGLEYVGDESTFSVSVGAQSSGSEPGVTPQSTVIADPTIHAFAVGGSLANGSRVVVALLDFAPADVFISDDLTAIVGAYEGSRFASVTFDILGPQSLDRVSVTVDEVLIGITAGVGTSYCGPAVANSTGASASIFALGSDEVADDDVTLRALSLPPNSFSFFLASETQGSTPNAGGSQGTLCLGGAIGRFVGPGQIQNAGAAGEVALALDLSQIPQPSGFVGVTAGQTWNFQAWYRDSVNGTPTSNFTDGVSVTFL